MTNISVSSRSMVGGVTWCSPMIKRSRVWISPIQCDWLLRHPMTGNSSLMKVNLLEKSVVYYTATFWQDLSKYTLSYSPAKFIVLTLSFTFLYVHKYHLCFTFIKHIFPLRISMLLFNSEQTSDAFSCLIFSN